jgi:hypothetical protein
MKWIVFLLLIKCIPKAFHCFGLFCRRKEEEEFDAALEMTLKPLNLQRTFGYSFAVLNQLVLVV